MKHRTALGLVVLLAAISTGAEPAQAGLKVCNQADFKLSVAVGYVDREKGWVGKGWLTLESGQCKDAIKARLDNRYYYFHARGRGPDGKVVKFGGETPFCIQSQKFLLYQAEYGKDTEEECSKAGLRSEMFQKVDVNKQPDYTINLGLPANPQGASTGPATAGPASTAPAGAGPASADPAPSAAQPPPSVARRRSFQQPPNQPPQNQPAPSPSAAPSGEKGGAACQRYPNLC